jgi:hypothetical protein
LLTIDQTDCDEISGAKCAINNFSNQISWHTGCAGKLLRYRIYAASTPGGEFELIADDVADTLYVDKNLSSFARCYKILAVDNKTGVRV